MRRFLLLCMFLALCGGTVFSVDVGDVIRRAEEPFTLDRVFSVSEMSTYRGDSLDRTMELESYTLTSDGVTKSLVVYTDPIRMRGTAYLTIGNDLWVRFGSTGRVRKLSSSAKTGSAGGSDFSYEDLGEDSGGISESYGVRLLSERSRLGGADCYEIELTPRPDSDSSYDRLIAYITRETYHYVAIHYYESGAHTKTLTLEDYRPLGGLDYPYAMTMRTLTSNTRTTIEVTDIQVGTDAVRDSMFTVQYLERLR